MDGCGSELSAGGGRFTMISVTTNSVRMTPLSTPMAQASLTKSRPRLPVGSKNIGLPAIEIARAIKTCLKLRHPLPGGLM
jgi:hypothetical protein